MSYLTKSRFCVVLIFTFSGCAPDDGPREPAEEPPEPRVVERTEYARTIAAAGAQTWALDRDGEVVWWGPEGLEQFPFEGRCSEFSGGQSDADGDWVLCAVGDSYYPSVCLGRDNGRAAEDVVHSAAGSSDTQCFQRTDKTLQCFGLDDYAVPESADFDSLVGQGESFCGLKLGEAPVCWGATLAETPTGDRLAFVSDGQWCQIDDGVECSGGVEFDLGVSDALQISAGPEMVCVLDSSGELACDGSSRALENLPEASTRFVEIAVGQAHGCGIKESGEFVCWGTWILDSEEILAESPAEVVAF